VRKLWIRIEGKVKGKERKEREQKWSRERGTHPLDFRTRTHLTAHSRRACQLAHGQHVSDQLMYPPRSRWLDGEKLTIRAGLYVRHDETGIHLCYNVTETRPMRLQAYYYNIFLRCVQVSSVDTRVWEMF